MWFKQGACFGRVRSFEPRAVVSFAVASTGTRADSRAAVSFAVSFAVAARTPVAGRARCFIASPRRRRRRRHGFFNRGGTHESRLDKTWEDEEPGNLAGVPELAGGRGRRRMNAHVREMTITKDDSRRTRVRDLWIRVAKATGSVDRQPPDVETAKRRRI